MSNAMAVLIRAVRYCEGESVERDVALEAEEYEPVRPEYFNSEKFQSTGGGRSGVSDRKLLVRDIP
jgi:hypothetical protein